MIYWNADLAEKIACTREEMESLPEYIDHLLEVSKVVRQTGIQPALQQFSYEKDALLRYGLLLVSEGLAGEILEEMLAILLYVTPEKGLNFLRQCIAAEAILSIANGEDKDTLVRKLLPYCGIDKALVAMSTRKLENAD
jgi:flagellar motor component MotA